MTKLRKYVFHYYYLSTIQWRFGSTQSWQQVDVTNRCYPPTAPGQVTTSILRTLALADPWNWSILCVIAGFRRVVYEILALLGRYAAQIGSYRRFGSSYARTTWLLKTGQIVWPETSRINYQSNCVTPPEERRSYLFLSSVELRFSLQLVNLYTI